MSLTNPTHYWVVFFDGCPFGIQEVEASGYVLDESGIPHLGVPTTTTMIYFGGQVHVLQTQLPAYAVLGIGLVGLLVTISAVVFTISRFCRRVEAK